MVLAINVHKPKRQEKREARHFSRRQEAARTLTAINSLSTIQSIEKPGAEPLTAIALARRALAGAETRALLDGCQNERDRALVAILAGDRYLLISDLIRLMAPDVDLLARTLCIQRGSTRLLCVTLTEAAVKALAPLLGRPDGLIWVTADRRPLPLYQAKRNLDRIGRRAGLAGWWHAQPENFGSN